MKAVGGLDSEPPGLARYREAYPESRDWNDFRDFESGKAYKDLIDRLTSIQRGLCAYCEIDLTDTDQEVEHFHPKCDAASPVNWTFEPSNLVAACRGGVNPYSTDDARRALRPSRNSRSCGAAKGERTLDGTDPRYPKILKPTDLTASPSLFEVLHDGRIKPASDACAQAGIPIQEASATVTELNLNCERLQIARQAVWDALSASLESGERDDAAYLSNMKAMAEEMLRPHPDGRLERFFTTMRSFFGVVGEEVLRRSGTGWV